MTWADPRDTSCFVSPVGAEKNPCANDLARNCPRIYGDSGYLHQVFLNLINNSADAMPRGGELRVVLRGPAPEEPPEVEVVHRGHGNRDGA